MVSMIGIGPPMFWVRVRQAFPALPGTASDFIAKEGSMSLSSEKSVDPPTKIFRYSQTSLPVALTFANMVAVEHRIGRMML